MIISLLATDDKLLDATSCDCYCTSCTVLYCVQVWARTQDTHLCDSLLFSMMTVASRLIDFLRNLFRI